MDRVGSSSSLAVEGRGKEVVAVVGRGGKEVKSGKRGGGGGGGGKEGAKRG